MTFRATMNSATLPNANEGPTMPCFLAGAKVTSATAKTLTYVCFASSGIHKCSTNGRSNDIDANEHRSRNAITDCQ